MRSLLRHPRRLTGTAAVLCVLLLTGGTAVAQSRRPRRKPPSSAAIQQAEAARHSELRATGKRVQGLLGELLAKEAAEETLVMRVGALVDDAVTLAEPGVLRRAYGTPRVQGEAAAVQQLATRWVESIEKYLSGVPPGRLMEELPLPGQQEVQGLLYQSMWPAPGPAAQQVRSRALKFLDHAGYLEAAHGVTLEGLLTKADGDDRYLAATKAVVAAEEKLEAKPPTRLGEGTERVGEEPVRVSKEAARKMPLLRLSKALRADLVGPAPVPDSTPGPTPDPTPDPTPEPTPEPATPTPTPTPSPSPTPTPTPEPPTPTPTPEPPTPTPTPDPTPEPEPEPEPPPPPRETGTPIGIYLLGAVLVLAPAGAFFFSRKQQEEAELEKTGTIPRLKVDDIDDSFVGEPLEARENRPGQKVKTVLEESSRDLPPEIVNRGSKTLPPSSMHLEAGPTEEPPGDLMMDSGALARGADPGALPEWLATAITGTLGDRYEELRLLGSGGMGCVVKARDTRLQRWVALKVPPLHLITREYFLTRFLQEAQALALLSHPNVARVHAVPEVPRGKVPIIVMEYIEGTDLESVLNSGKRPDWKDVVSWVQQVGAALDHAHQRGIVHRDVKPANIMLTGEGVKLLDFGLASVEDGASLTRSGMLMGSVPYMPPEQLRGEKVGPMADQYSLAATAFELFTGEVLFDAEDRLRENPPNASTKNFSIPEALDGPLKRALHPEPAERFPAIARFVAELVRAAR